MLFNRNHESRFSMPKIKQLEPNHLLIILRECLLTFSICALLILIQVLFQLLSDSKFPGPLERICLNTVKVNTRRICTCIPYYLMKTSWHSAIDQCRNFATCDTVNINCNILFSRECKLYCGCSSERVWIILSEKEMSRFGCF